jgi:hypothetical protein
MSVKKNEEIRFRMLEILYKNFKEEVGGWGVDRHAMFEQIDVTEKDMDYNMLYLTRNGLANIKESAYVQWHWAKISDLGIAVIESKEQYIEQFPFLLVALEKE